VSGVLFFARELNMLALGEATAQSAGVNVRRVSNLVLAFAALATASGVAATGIIAFVGLVVPHLVRLVFGADHTFLLPASFLVGAIFLTSADTAARMIFNPVVLQTGTITSLIGAPFLLFLVLRKKDPR
jgi:iron complex transport system permease protein